MPLYNLATRRLEDTYPYVTQVSKSSVAPDKWSFADGLGNPVYWFDGTASYAITASYALNGVGASAISVYSGSSLLTSNLSSLVFTGSGFSASVVGNQVTLSFDSGGGIPAPPDMAIQFNSGGAPGVFDGHESFLFNYNLFSVKHGSLNSEACGSYSYTQGSASIAYGDYSHAEGLGTITSGSYSHAEGGGTKTYALGYNSADAGISVPGTIYLDASYGDKTAEFQYSNYIILYDYNLFFGNTYYAKGFKYTSVTYDIGLGQTVIVLEDNTVTAGSDVYIYPLNNPSPAGVDKTGVGDYSHVEGSSNTVIGVASHAEGQNTLAGGQFSHAEGTGTIAAGFYAHAEGESTSAVGNASHAEGGITSAEGERSHAEGQNTTSKGFASHAEGSGSISMGIASHAEGWSSSTYGTGSHAEGFFNSASGNYSHAEGGHVLSKGIKSHAEGSGSVSHGLASHAEGFNSISSGSYSHAEGDKNVARGWASHAEGSGSYAGGLGAHTEGELTFVTNQTDYGHAEGGLTYVFGDYSHAEGYGSSASYGIKLEPVANHAEGYYTKAIGRQAAHSEGGYTIADGLYSHAEGSGSVTSRFATSSHAEGIFTVASGAGQLVVGRYNLHGNDYDYFVIGDGTNDTNRSNAFGVNASRMYASNSIFFPDLTDVYKQHILVFDTGSKQVYYRTASDYGSGGTGTVGPGTQYYLAYFNNTNTIASNTIYYNVIENRYEVQGKSATVCDPAYNQATAPQPNILYDADVSLKDADGSNLYVNNISNCSEQVVVYCAAQDYSQGGGNIPNGYNRGPYLVPLKRIDLSQTYITYGLKLDYSLLIFDPILFGTNSFNDTKDAIGDYVNAYPPYVPPSYTETGTIMVTFNGFDTATATGTGPVSYVTSNPPLPSQFNPPYNWRTALPEFGINVTENWTYSYDPTWVSMTGPGAQTVHDNGARGFQFAYRVYNDLASPYFEMVVSNDMDRGDIYISYVTTILRHKVVI